MDRYFNLKLPVLSRKSGYLLLASFWIPGLLTGAFVSLSAESSLIPLMRAAVLGRVSIVGLLTAILLPFLLSAFAVFMKMPWLLMPLAFLKGFLVSYLGVGVMAAYGSAGWLMRLLLLFSECCTLPLLFWFWSCCICRAGRISPADWAVVASAVFIGSFDFCFVSPFLATVIS